MGLAPWKGKGRERAVSLPRVGAAGRRRVQARAWALPRNRVGWDFQLPELGEMNVGCSGPSSEASC